MNNRVRFNIFEKLILDEKLYIIRVNKEYKVLENVNVFCVFIFLKNKTRRLQIYESIFEIYKKKHREK